MNSCDFTMSSAKIARRSTNIDYMRRDVMAEISPGTQLRFLSPHIPLYDDYVQRGHNFIFSQENKAFSVKNIFKKSENSYIVQTCSDRFFYLCNNSFISGIIDFV